MTGYSGTPLVRKLGLKAGQRVAWVRAPAGFDDLLGPLPDGVERLPSPAAGMHVILVFTRAAAELRDEFDGYAGRLVPAGMLWVAWPKRASRVPTDLTEDRVREIALPRGWVDVKVCAIDDVWSGLKLVRRRENR